MSMKGYKKKIEPEKFQYVPEMINQRFNSPEPEPIVHMAVCHKILFDQVGYHHSGRKIHSSDRMMKTLSGDCQDHGVLLATLFKACGLEVSILRVDIMNKNVCHILVEVKNPLHSIQETCDSLRRFYWNQFDFFVDNISYEKHRGNYWIVADTAGDQEGGWSDYVGDISAHIGQCIKKRRDGTWDWAKLKSRAEV